MMKAVPKLLLNKKKKLVQDTRGGTINLGGREEGREGKK